MKYAVDSRQMKIIDDYTINVLKVPAMVLMERAANDLAAFIKCKINKSDPILAVCGSGNNGGDGIAAGRILFLQGYHVAILFIGDECKASNQVKEQLEIARNLGMRLEHHNKLHEYNIIIDAIFGIGLSRPITGIYEEIINQINKNQNIVFSVDIPSGISADSGKILGTAVKADYTVTFGYQKQGLLLYPGADYSGKIVIADIGFPNEAALQAKTETFYYEQEDLTRLPVRLNYSHKGTYGKVLVIAGSKGMAGAAYLSAKAAYRSGAGLVKILTSEANRVILQTSLPEALFTAYDEETETEARLEKIAKEISWASVIVIGPGLGVSSSSEELLTSVLEKAAIPVIIDADGITLLSKLLDSELLQLDYTEKQDRRTESLLTRTKILSDLLGEHTILTPHLMELSRLIGISITEITNNLIDTTCQCSYNNNLIYAIKDARSIVSQNHSRYINTSGNNGMATGGSGDVLTGIIAAFIAQGMKPYEAACLAVYIHGLAGDAAADEKGKYSLMAGDIINFIEKVLHS